MLNSVKADTKKYDENMSMKRADEETLPIEHQLEVSNLKVQVLRLQREVTALNNACMRKNYAMKKMRERSKRHYKTAKNSSVKD